MYTFVSQCVKILLGGVVGCGGVAMTFREALEIMGKDESFRATIYAMNTLLIKKGVYTSKEFEQLVCEHAMNFQRRFCGAKAETSHVAAQASL